MKPSTVLVAASILAAAIAYAGYQTSDRLVYVPPTEGGNPGVFQLTAGSVRYCLKVGVGRVLCSNWQ
jgi:hypothetical protein